MTRSADTTGEAVPALRREPESEPAYRWTGEFADPVLEDNYIRASWTEIRSRLGAVLIAVYDNLGKGASGAAVQNMDLMLGRVG